MSTNPIETRRYDDLNVRIHADADALGRDAASAAADVLRDAILARGHARVIMATGNSQIPFFSALRSQRVAWDRVELLHMDEYLGLDEDHPASFRRFLRERVVEPLGIGTFHGISGDVDGAEATMRSYARLLENGPVDLCCMGIGENGHLAFNDPPYARFDDPHALRVVQLDEVSRRQQVGEGHFQDLAHVPTHAITLTIPALLNAERVLVVVPEERKAPAVRAALEDPIDSSCPASILRTAQHAGLYLDAGSARLLGA